MVSTRVALVTLVLAAAGCAAKREASSSAPSTGGMDKSRAEIQRAPGQTAGSAAPTPTTVPADPTPAREQARASGIVGPSDELGSDVKSGFNDEPKGGRGGDGKGSATPAKPAVDGRNVVGGAPSAPEPAKAPAVRVDIATLQGDPSGALKSLAEDHLTEIRACYDKARAKNAALKGRLDVSFSVNGEGTIIAPMVASTSTTKDRALGGCIVGIVAKLKLDRVPTPPIKGVLVFVFGE